MQEFKLKGDQIVLEDIEPKFEPEEETSEIEKEEQGEQEEKEEKKEEIRKEKELIYPDFSRRGKNVQVNQEALPFREEQKEPQKPKKLSMKKSIKKSIKKIAKKVIIDAAVCIIILMAGAIVSNIGIVIDFYKNVSVASIITIALVIVFLASHISYEIGKRKK